jgi:chemotaxis signal transduction protein
MNPGCLDLFESEPRARDRLENAHADRRRLGRSPTGIEWLLAEQSMTTQSPTGPKRWFCLFRGDGGPMAVSLESVAEILETDTLVRLAWGPPQVVGLCSYHRDVVPVVALGPLPPELGDDLSSGQDQAVATGTAGAKDGNDDRSRCVVLILRTEHGAWGIQVDAQNTIMSRESPEYHPPRVAANAPVLIGVVRHAAIGYRILDAEATWRRLRAAVARWSGLMSESNPSISLPFGEDPMPAGSGARAELGEASA